MAEVPATEAELNFLDESPPGLFPENQDSVAGIFRKVFSDQMQDAADQLLTIYRERFVETASVYLDMWEKEVGLPVNPGTLDTATRQARILARLRQGPFTSARRKQLIESYIGATFGTVAAIGSGIPILAGIPLHAASGVVTQLYRVYEDVLTYSYKIWIDSTTTIDIAGLTKDLTFLTPSGISFTIDQTHTTTGLIHWQNTMKDFAPSGWWGLDTTYNDSSSFANNGTVTGAPTAIATPGLLTGVAGTDAARDFSGTGQYVTIPDAAILNSPLFTLRATVRPDTLPSSGNYRIAYWAGGTTLATGTFIGIANIAGVNKFVARVYNGTTFVEAQSSLAPVAGTTYQLMATYDGVTLKLFVNGVVQDTEAFAGPAVLTGTKYIARDGAGGSLWDGGLDEIAYFGYKMSEADALYLSNQARNIL